MNENMKWLEWGGLNFLWNEIAEMRELKNKIKENVVCA